VDVYIIEIIRPENRSTSYFKAILYETGKHIEKLMLRLCESEID
jgi:hypothetical protein